MCGRRDRLPLPQCLVSTQYFVLYAIMLGYYNFVMCVNTCTMKLG